ncbi:MAG TPA: SRPBCC domain-containing protein [Gaiellaceae bacterium]|nr:SRPBCC domain-containing protein [Gaiellaceae bacterium]
MKVEGTRSYAASREQVWAVLNDPAEMAGLMPGVENFELLDETHWRAKVKVPLGLGSMRMSIDFEKADSRPPEHARLQAKGKGVGAIMSMETEFDLSEDGAGTAMRWQADVRILGQVASMGQRVIQPIVNQQVENVLGALDRRVSAKAAGAAAGGPPSSG